MRAARTARATRLAWAVLALVAAPGGARAAVDVAIDLTHQRMHVRGAGGRYDWPISSARSGFSTPGGTYVPTRLEAMHYSRKYDMAPMPHAIFFHGGYAIHGTGATGALGRPASHGCVRLAPAHAALLFRMVQAEGARIAIGGTPPAGAIGARVSRRAPAAAAAPMPVPPTAAPPKPGRRTLDAYAAAGYRFVGLYRGRRVFQAVGAAPYDFGNAR